MKEKLVKMTVRFDTLNLESEKIFKIVYRVEGLIAKEWIVMAADIIPDTSPFIHTRSFIREDKGASDYRVTIQYPSLESIPYTIQVQKGEVDWS